MSNEIKKTMKSLRERAREFNAQLPLMDGREKGEVKTLLGQITTINDYGFLTNEKGQVYVAFTVKERSKEFFFGGLVLTERLTELDAEGYGDAIREEGLPVLMTEAKGKKSNLNYTNVDFFPEV